MGDDYAPPPGPPPKHQQPLSEANSYQPPPGPPPTNARQHSSNASSETYQPPPGPPPSKQFQAQQPPAYEPWLSIPDSNPTSNSLLPPPPSLTSRQHKTSPTYNASATSADAAHTWTDTHPLNPPTNITSQDLHLLRAGLPAGSTRLLRNPELRGDIEPDRSGPNCWHVTTASKSPDSCLISERPLYSALASRHDAAGKPSTLAYFEVSVISMGGPSPQPAKSSRHHIFSSSSSSSGSSARGQQQQEEAGIAIGFVATPYPTWRLPGWERGSLGVHGDDGRRYVNDTYGGRDFARKFSAGDVLGIGWRASGLQTGSASGKMGGKAGQKAEAVEVFFTRNGKEEGMWDLYEEIDAGEDRPGGVTGLEGDFDLHAAVGTFGRCEFVARFGRENWMYRP